MNLFEDCQHGIKCMVTIDSMTTMCQRIIQLKLCIWSKSIFSEDYFILGLIKIQATPAALALEIQQHKAVYIYGLGSGPYKSLPFQCCYSFEDRPLISCVIRPYNFLICNYKVFLTYPKYPRDIYLSQHSIIQLQTKSNKKQSSPKLQTLNVSL